MQGRARITRLRKELCSDSFHPVLAWSCGRAKCQCCTATLTVVVYRKWLSVWLTQYDLMIGFHFLSETSLCKHIQKSSEFTPKRDRTTPPWIIRAVPIRDRSIFSVLFIMASFWIYYDFNGFLCLIRSIKDYLPMRARSLRAVQEMYLLLLFNICLFMMKLIVLKWCKN